MYSKDRGITHDGGSPIPPRQPAYRQPSRPRMQVPPNYSGHAIVDGEERPLGHIPEPEPPAETPLPDSPTPRFDDLPKVSDLGDSRRRSQVRTVPATFEETEREASEPENPNPSRDPAPTPPPAESASVASAPVARPSLFDLSRFPFGHGIGFEELLILGLILFLLHESGECEDRGDIDETVILLGLLLLLG